ncbi:hypothetical protein J6590_012267 [Homalodisca vitripennis]|nr:hypothetical protein J6590_012267 [Homalodisca vitripennis]
MAVMGSKSGACDVTRTNVNQSINHRALGSHVQPTNVPTYVSLMYAAIDTRPGATLVAKAGTNHSG